MNEKFDIKDTINCVGKSCSELAKMTKEAMEDMKKGELIAVLSDEPDAESELKHLVLATDHELVRIFDEDDNVKRYLIRKLERDRDMPPENM